MHAAGELTDAEFVEAKQDVLANAETQHPIAGEAPTSQSEPTTVDEFEVATHVILDPPSGKTPDSVPLRDVKSRASARSDRLPAHRQRPEAPTTPPRKIVAERGWHWSEVGERWYCDAHDCHPIGDGGGWRCSVMTLADACVWPDRHNGPNEVRGPTEPVDKKRKRWQRRASASTAPRLVTSPPRRVRTPADTERAIRTGCGLLVLAAIVIAIIAVIAHHGGSGSGVTGGSAADTAAQQACYDFYKVTRDAHSGIVASDELRPRIQQINDEASASSNAAVSSAATRLLAADTSGDTTAFNQATTDMINACFAYQTPNP